ncbi:hypothetical protein B0I31_106399 [Saccharothrix carnea]|uniref:5-bromo-4-chloroindolyl phosphate hydrolysis protein n=1 Tax=Saccharothrix carnea TaxID=1280637 RepID=A0A2P8I8S9_SACCR|nr:hypothetical protein [Saccharothrix carnea]PSL54879.1 hypothetical protein B0I31_106399 [Saccharothrix carnea]
MGRSALWGLLIGTALMTILIMFGLAVPSSDDDGDTMWAAAFVASGIVGVVMGGIPGTLIGLVVGAVRRRRPAIAPPPMPMPFPPPLPPPPLNDRWSAMVGRCELAVRRVHAAVATVPASPAREWLERIAARFAAELPDVRRLADLGRALDADHQHPVTDRLSAAVRDFTSFEDEVGRAALRLLNQTTLDAVRTDLEVLEQQLPHLGSP